MLTVAGKEIVLTPVDIKDIKYGCNINKIVYIAVGDLLMSVKVKGLVEKFEDFEINAGVFDLYYFKTLKITFYCLFDEKENEVRTKKKHREIINGVLLSSCSVRIT